MAGCDDGFFRPMLFKELWSTPTDGLDAWTAEQWSKLDAQSAPDPYSLLSPGTKAPTWNKALVDKRRYVGIWHPAQHIELRVVRPSFDAFIEAFNFLTGAPNRFRLQTLDTFTENDRQYFIGNFRYGGTGSHFVSAFSNWEAFLADVEARHADGLELLDMCNWTADGFHWFSGVFGAGQNGLKPRVYTDLPAFQADVDNRAVKGEQLFALDTFRDTAGPRNWIGVFRKDAARSNLIHGSNWAAFTDTWSKQGTKTDWRRITDAVTGDGHWVGVIRPDPNKNGQILLLHTTWGKFTQACERVGYDGWRLVHVAVAGTLRGGGGERWGGGRGRQCLARPVTGFGRVKVITFDAALVPHAFTAVTRTEYSPGPSASVRLVPLPGDVSDRDPARPATSRR